MSRPAGSPPLVWTEAACGCRVSAAVRINDPARHAAWHALVAEQEAARISCADP